MAYGGTQETEGIMRKGNRAWIAGLAIVLALGMWHLNDVRSGAVQSGDGWLVDRYLLLLAMVLAVTVTLAFFLSGKTDGRGRGLERVYPLAGAFLGLLYMVVLPPLSAPDEISHYISAYQLSSHLLGQPANSEDGHVLVRPEDWFLEDVHGDYVYGIQDGQRVKQGTKDGSGLATVLGQTLTEETYRVIHQVGLGRQQGPAEQGLAQSPYPPVVTTPLAFMPQALGLCLARLIKGNSLCLVYLGRLTNLLFFVGVTWMAMKRLPFGKEVLFSVALLPMTLHLSASFSYDAWIMAGIFYFTAYCLNLAYEAEQVRMADILVLAAVMAAVGPCKMVYMVFAGLCLLIPLHKFKSRRNWLLSACIVLAAMALGMAFTSSWRVASHVAGTENSMGWAEETGYTLGALLHQPMKYMQMFFNTVARQSEQYFRTMVGACLGNLDPVLDITDPVVFLLAVCLMCIALRKPEEPLMLTGGRRLWVWVLCISCAGATMLSMLLSVTPVGAQVIGGVQGRYFLPFLPILLMTVKNNSLVMARDQAREWLYAMCCANGYILLRIYSTVSIRL